MSAIRLVISVYIDPRLLLTVRAVGVLSNRLGSPLFARKILELDEEPILIFIPLIVPVEPSFKVFLFDEVARVVVGIFGVEDGVNFSFSKLSVSILEKRSCLSRLSVRRLSILPSLSKLITVTRCTLPMTSSRLAGWGSGGVGVGLLSFPQEARGTRRSAVRASVRWRKVTFIACYYYC